MTDDRILVCRFKLDGDAQAWLEIDAATGDIKTKANLDREKLETIEVTVTAFEKGERRHLHRNFRGILSNRIHVNSSPLFMLMDIIYVHTAVCVHYIFSWLLFPSEGNPEKSSEQVIHVHLLDVNDNVPTLTETQAFICMKDSKRVTIKAEDKDSDPFSKPFTFSFAKKSPNWELIRIDGVLVKHLRQTHTDRQMEVT